MRKILCVVLVCIIVFSLIGCGAKSTVVAVHVDDKDNLTGAVFGKDALIEIGSGLWYDSTTRIVYWWNGCMTAYTADTTPSPYYAPNGFPYLYNPQTNTFEEIELVRG